LDRDFLRDVLELPNVDVGHGWLVFGLPPSELAVHPSRKNDVHEFYFLCADVRAFAAAMTKRGIRCGPIRSLGWGELTEVTLPGGGKLGVYEPHHARPGSARPRAAAKRGGAKKRARTPRGTK
jgi:hypothetical protein